jgi:anti-sigma factor RsiW
VSCDPERVTALVDGELDAKSLAEAAAHLAGCPACREQAKAEREIRARLKALPAPDLPAGLAGRVRSAVRRRRVATRAGRWALPLAAALVLWAWLPGHPSFLTWDLARDHAKCFSRRPVPARVWSGEPEVVEGWFTGQGTAMPSLPDGVGDLRLVGARYCPLASLSFAPHVYYSSLDRHVSVFVVRHGVRLRERYEAAPRGRAVRLVRVEGAVVGIVGERASDVQAMESAINAVAARVELRGAGRQRPGKLPASNRQQTAFPPPG